MDTLLSCPGQNRLNQHWMGSNFCDLEPLFKMLVSIYFFWPKDRVSSSHHMDPSSSLLGHERKTNWSGLAYLKNRLGDVHSLDYSVTTLEWKNVLKCLKRFSWFSIESSWNFFTSLVKWQRGKAPNRGPSVAAAPLSHLSRILIKVLQISV